MENDGINVDPLEIEKFSQLAHRWWDPNSEFKPLHDINPLRLNYIEELAGMKGKTVVDVGCGGGILSESMAASGANVTGIDLSEKALKVAKLHLLESGQQADYRKITVESLAQEKPQHFDIVTCMEMLEHVPDPMSVIQSCTNLVKPGGWVFFSTINRNPKSYLMAIVGAEYVMKMLPRGTHNYARFIRPSELDQCARDAGLRLKDLKGVSYNAFTGLFSQSQDVDVNYMVHYTRPLSGSESS